MYPINQLEKTAIKNYPILFFTTHRRLIFDRCLVLIISTSGINPSLPFWNHSPPPLPVLTWSHPLWPRARGQFLPRGARPTFLGRLQPLHGAAEAGHRVVQRARCLAAHQALLHAGGHALQVRPDALQLG